MRVGDVIRVPARVGAVGFVTPEDLQQGLLVLGMAMNPLVPVEPYEVVELRKDGMARIKYVGKFTDKATRIAAGPFLGAAGVAGVCWVDAADMKPYVSKGES